jgi:uncharacterized protein (DUF2062 family)
MNWLKKLKERIPSPDLITEQPHLPNIFGDALCNREIWSFNRVSVSRGLAFGVFCAFLPMPGETLIAAFMAIFLRANLPLSIAVVWISNPITWVPMYTAPYLLGSWIIDIEPIALGEINIMALGWHYVALWLGCLIAGIFSALLVRWLIDLLWRLQIRQNWQRRRRQRMIRKLRHTSGLTEESRIKR